MKERVYLRDAESPTVRRLQTVKHMTSPPRASDPREERASVASGLSWALPLSQSDAQHQHQPRAPPTDATGHAGLVVTGVESQLL